MINFELIHLLLVFVLLLSLLHLQIFVLAIQKIELFRLLLFHFVVSLDKREVFCAQARINNVLLLLHVSAQSLLHFAPVLHQPFPYKHDAT